MPITQQALDVHQAMSSRHWCATEEYRTKCKNKLEEVTEKKYRKKIWKCVVKSIAGKSATKVGRKFRIVVNTIAGKSYEITKLEPFDQVGYLKDILRNTIIPTPSLRRMSMIFKNNMLDDKKMLWEYNIGDGSELDLVMLSPPPRKGFILDRSRSRSPFRFIEGSPGRVHMLELCREV